MSRVGFFLRQGPFVQVDELMETLRRCTLPESESLFALFSINSVFVVVLVAVNCYWFDMLLKCFFFFFLRLQLLMLL